MRVRRTISPCLVLLLAAAVHVDWHLGRPEHLRHSLGSPLHWLLAIPVFALAAWWVARRWPERPVAASVLNLGLALFLGQVLEPALETLFFREPLLRAWATPRWPVFFAFLAAGVGTYAVVLTLLLRSRSAGPAPKKPGT
jgi:hypothetical protein